MSAGAAMCLLFYYTIRTGDEKWGLIELLLLAVGLSMDAFAVSICKGLAIPKIRLSRGLCHLRRLVRRIPGADAA
jgi:hypothetical protein